MGRGIQVLYWAAGPGPALTVDHAVEIVRWHEQVQSFITTYSAFHYIFRLKKHFLSDFLSFHQKNWPFWILRMENGPILRAKSQISVFLSRKKLILVTLQPDLCQIFLSKQRYFLRHFLSTYEAIKGYK